MEKNKASSIFLALFLFCFFSISQAIWISLPPSGTKCVSEEIQHNVVVLADYVVLQFDQSSHPTVAVKVHFFSLILSPFSILFHGLLLYFRV
jgi:hypothetical protein